MKPYSRLILLVLALPLLCGCAGLLIDAVARSSVTGGPFSEVAKSLPPLAPDSGRLYLYRTEATTNTALRGNVITGAMLLKNPTVCTVGVHVHEVIWETFRYVDLPEGQHEITCGADVVKSTGRRPVYQRGANRMRLMVTKTGAYFVRLDAAVEPAFFKPVLVEAAQALDEIANLPQQVGDKAHSFPRGVVAD